VRVLLRNGVSAKHLDKSGFAPLVRASVAAGLSTRGPEALEVIDLLLEFGADIEQAGPVAPLPVAPLDAAARSSSARIVAYLLDKGANVNAGEADGRTALYQAVRLGKAQVAEELIRRHATLNAQTAEGWVPLHLAVHNGMESTVRLLVTSGALINVRDREGKTPLAWARGNVPSEWPKEWRGTRATPEILDFLVNSGAVD
jgi:ankyrin repeat protein